MDIHHLRVFASVFRNKSFSKASIELNLTQPTISNHIKAVEDEFECRLFDRLGRTIIPTKEAEVLYRHAVEIIEKTGELKEALLNLKKDLTGRLIVGASTIPGVYLLPKIMTEFQKRNASISFQISISDSRGIIDNISRHEILLGIVGAKIGNDQIEYAPFVEDELVAVAGKEDPHDALTFGELVALPMVLREEGSGTRKVVEKFLESKGMSVEELKIAGIFGSTDAVKQAVKAGLGVSIVSRFSVADELECNILKEIKITDMEMKRMFYIVSHKKRTLPRLYDAFLAHLREETKKK